ncbi:protein-L-isoaspartate O-methyltransferase [Endozoicomonas sp. OPT23]|uniref:protein-L-isoaspartate(D-aspartate) O-methyltransferase n=1 Tax=Endozoicomonas sp. OPT23 TaxID=2072845 RepID=UPI00129A3453|nr:protein-L-isoaspartate(D-aspartate) O-methyltransferase [Endozoicomonas sp. OPT23]MRI34931.1 protein-L-isoaspartate O-methyltransferase [Endozoicomonas sp. OPT23]
MDLDGIGMTSRRTRDRLVNRLRDQGIRSDPVLGAIQNVPRHLFLEEALSHRAYEDTALPIGFNQTLSQPYIVARMTEALLAAGHLKKVLEIGTGSGYQTLILSELVDRVYSVERIAALQDRARKLLRKLSVRNVQYHLSDGGYGWSMMGPFDGIIVTAAPEKVPEDLLSQLSPRGGRLVIPVGDSKHQELLLIVREGGSYRRERLEPVRFVPLLNGTVR